ncbi:MAG: NUDIX domain-containing protein [Spirosomataceae bacterium]
MRYHNTGLFALPGGFVRKDENLNDAVRRGLKERTGLDNIYLEQFYTFGDVSRYQAATMQTILESNGYSLTPIRLAFR